MNYDIPEIQNERETLRIGDNVIYHDDKGKKRECTVFGSIYIGGTYFYSLSIKNLGYITVVHNVKREDLIWIPTTDDLIELMGIKTNHDFFVFLHTNNLEFGEFTLKDYFVHLFMFTKKKVLKNGKWEGL